jgi:hypothetical protein
MLGATLIAVFFIPLFYVLLTKLAARVGKKREGAA